MHLSHVLQKQIQQIIKTSSSRTGMRKERMDVGVVYSRPSLWKILTFFLVVLLLLFVVFLLVVLLLLLLLFGGGGRGGE